MPDIWLEKIKRGLHIICNVMELILAAAVLLGIVCSAFHLFREAPSFMGSLGDTKLFQHFLEQIFMLVIGIEFLQMLCKPNADNVMEILIFLVARHMIVGDTTPVEDFVSVISVCLLCVLRRYLHNLKAKDGKEGEYKNHS
mgnify:CR=1 FL=1